MTNKCKWDEARLADAFTLGFTRCWHLLRPQFRATMHPNFKKGDQWAKDYAAAHALPATDAMRVAEIMQGHQDDAPAEMLVTLRDQFGIAAATIRQQAIEIEALRAQVEEVKRLRKELREQALDALVAQGQEWGDYDDPPGPRHKALNDIEELDQ